jgi:hypothetical protein
VGLGVEGGEEGARDDVVEEDEDEAEDGLSK